MELGDLSRTNAAPRSLPSSPPTTSSPADMEQTHSYSRIGRAGSDSDDGGDYLKSSRPVTVRQATQGDFVAVVANSPHCESMSSQLYTSLLQSHEREVGLWEVKTDDVYPECFPRPGGRIKWLTDSKIVYQRDLSDVLYKSVVKALLCPQKFSASGMGELDTKGDRERVLIETVDE